MAIVTKEFTYHDNGIFPVVHLVGEEVEGAVETFAVSQGYAGEDTTSPVIPVITNKRKGRK